MAIVTDLNQRERTKYARTFESMAKVASDLAAALREGDDTAALLHLVYLSLATASANELGKIFQSAVSADVPDHPPSGIRDHGHG